jgi:Sec-independent protein translocase protein TatA
MLLLGIPRLQESIRDTEKLLGELRKIKEPTKKDLKEIGIRQQQLQDLNIELNSLMSPF